MILVLNNVRQMPFCKDFTKNIALGQKKTVIRGYYTPLKTLI